MLGEGLAKKFQQLMVRRGWQDKLFLSKRDGSVTRYVIAYIEGYDKPTAAHPDGQPNANRPDAFDDLRCVFQFFEDGSGHLVFAEPATTEPGAFWTEHRMNPKGAFHIALGPQTAWVYGEYHGHPALRQATDLRGTRDDEEDFHRHPNEEDIGQFGVHHHGTPTSTIDHMGRSSAGCQVGFDFAQHDRFMQLLLGDTEYQNNHGMLWTSTVVAAHWLDEADGVLPHPMPVPVVVAPPLQPQPSGLISQKAIDLIVEQEVSSKAEYLRNYHHPEWPGAQSGVTIGIGYDCGYASAGKIAQDWAALPAEQIKLLQRCAGATGSRAQALLGDVKAAVDVPWEAAMAEFLSVEVPNWCQLCRNKLPNFDLLSPDCKGALVSLAYNRGASFGNSGERYQEMRAIRADMASKNFADIPRQFRDMKRLWQGRGLDGLLTRREAEAKMFEAGLLAKPQPPLAEPVPAPGPQQPGSKPFPTPAPQPAQKPTPALPPIPTAAKPETPSGVPAVIAGTLATAAGAAWFGLEQHPWLLASALVAAAGFSLFGAYWLIKKLRS